MRIIKYLFIFISLITLNACNEVSDTVSINYNSDDLIHVDYMEVINKLEQNGLNSIVSSPIDDLTSSNSELDGLVENVSINDKKSFTSGEIFPVNSNVVIEYHRLPRLKIEYNYDSLISKKYSEVYDLLTKSGFKNIEAIPLNDLNSNSDTSDESISELTINNQKGFTSDTLFPFDSKIIIKYHNIPKLKLPISSSEVNNFTPQQLYELFQQTGFENITTEEKYDIDPDTNPKGYKNKIYINNEATFIKNVAIPFDSNIHFVFHYPFEKYETIIHINFIPNLIFSKYDVNIKLNNENLGILKHGVNGDYTLNLKEGNYSLTFNKAGTSSVSGETTLTVSSPLEAEFSISCHNDYISVKENYIDNKTELKPNEIKLLETENSFKRKNYKEVVKHFENMGFNNITAVPEYDIYFGITEPESTSDVTISNSDSYRRGDIYQKDSPIVIKYHMPYTDDPARKEATSTASNNNTTSTVQSTQAPSSTPPIEFKRAAVVALTNYHAMDVFNESGDIDTTKFHSYADNSGDTKQYYMTVVNWGDWYQISENQWHVDRFNVKSYYKKPRNLALDVNYDNETYIISNIIDLDGTNPGNTLSYEGEDSSYIVPADFVKDDRKTNTSSISKSEEQNQIQLRDDQAMRAFQKMGEFYYPYGFKCHWYTGNRVMEQYEDGSWFIKVNVTVKNQYGNESDMIAEAYINATTQEVENFKVY